MLRLTARIHHHHVIAIAALAAIACKKNESEGEGSSGAGATARRAADPPAESQRTKLHPHRALLDEVSRAELDAGGLLVDFGGPDQFKYIRGSWRSGWGASHESKAGDRTGWVEVDGRRAFLDVIVPDPAPAAVALRARSPVAGQRVTLFASGTELGTVDLGAEWATHRVAVDAAKLPAGPTRLELRSSKGGSGGVRAEVDWLWLARDAAETAKPLLAPRTAPMNVDGKARRALIAPDPRTYSFYLLPPANASLVVDLGTAEKARFRVSVSVDGAEPAVLLDEKASAGWHEKVVSLADYAGKPIRLSLATSDQAGAVGWGEPEILLAKSDAPPAPPKAGTPPRNVILMVVDTTRADSYGPYARPDRVVQTPAFDQLAARSTAFTAAYNNENWTKPSVATTLTGLYPTTHDTKTDGAALPGEVETLSQRLKKEGFATAGFVANGYVSEKFGFDKGWDLFKNYIRQNLPSEAEHVYADAAAWLKERQEKAPGSPFFLYLQPIDPHVVYKVDEPYWSKYYQGSYRGPLGPTVDAEDQIGLSKKKIPSSEDNVGWLRALYWGETTYHDEYMGKFLAELDAMGLRDSTLVVITNDHGEELGERGRFGHGHQIYEELVRAPLLMSHDGLFPHGHQVSEVVEHVDLAPTILDALGREPLPEADGVSFLPLVQGKPYQRPGSALIEFLDGRRAIRVGHLKLIITTGEKTELYDLSADPDEKEELAATRPIARRLCELHLGEALAAPDKKSRLRGLGGKRRFQAGTADIDPQTRRQLEALGYFGATPKKASDGGGGANVEK